MRWCRLVSRNGHTFRRYDDLARSIATAVPGRAVLDGEIVCLGDDGSPQFYHLMRHRSPQYFFAFDLLWFDGEDLRRLPLRERKKRLRDVLDLVTSPQLRYVDHVERDGTLFYNMVCARDLEGIVAKKANGLYTPEATSWAKIKNPKYSQNEGRRELFDARRR